jgi:hypothetical protein
MLVTTIILSFVFACLGEDIVVSMKEKKTAYLEKNSAAMDKNTFSEKIYLIKDCVYYKKNLTVDGEIITEREVLFKRKVSLEGANEKMALIVFRNNNGTFVRGYEAYVPLSCLRKKERRVVVSNKQKGGSSSSLMSSVKGVFTKAPVKIAMTKEEVYKSDLLGDSKDKVRIKFLDFNVRVGDTVKFAEKFTIFRTGGPEVPTTTLRVNGKLVKTFEGKNFIEKGTLFEVREVPLVLKFSSCGAINTGFSSLSLEKIQ